MKVAGRVSAKSVLAQPDLKTRWAYVIDGHESLTGERRLVSAYKYDSEAEAVKAGRGYLLHRSLDSCLRGE